MLCQLHNNYPLASDKIETKKKILSNYQLKIADFYNILIDNAKTLFEANIEAKRHIVY